MKHLLLNVSSALLLFSPCLMVQKTRAQELNKRQIHADLKSVAGNKSMVYNECIGAGRANEGLRADWQQQLAMIQRDVHFKYIRFHGLLHDDMRIYSLDKAGKPVYNFQYVDRLYDFLLSINIRPFVEFGFMPPGIGHQNYFLVESQCNQA